MKLFSLYSITNELKDEVHKKFMYIIFTSRHYTYDIFNSSELEMRFTPYIREIYHLHFASRRLV